jgi:copper(I)-binding protein
LNPDNSAIYLPIKHQGNEPDALVAEKTMVATSAELYETMAKDGKMMMQPRQQFDIPAGGTLEMQPGSYHIMLLGL